MTPPRFPYYKPPVHEYQRIVGVVTLDQFFEGIRNPKPAIIETIKQIRQASEAGDKALKNHLKQDNLFFFLPNVQMNGESRGYASITAFNGTMWLDFDGMHHAHAEYFKHELFEQYRCLMATWLSTSANGFQGAVKIPVVKSVGEFMSYYNGFMADLQDNFQELFVYSDPSMQKPTQAVFLSHDPNILIREPEDIETWDVVGFDDGHHEIAGHTAGRISTPDWDWDKQKIYRKIYSGFGNIPRAHGGGHGGIRALSFAVGGYVADGSITEKEAAALFDELITSHPYLKKNITTYIKTARSGLKAGATKLKADDVS